MLDRLAGARRRPRHRRPRHASPPRPGRRASPGRSSAGVADLGAAVRAPHSIADVEQHWQSRPLDVDYDLREDRFSLLANVPVTGTVAEYRTQRFGGVDVYTLPTPGHTFGSVTYLVEIEGARVAFTGDLLYEGGQVWSLAATQWTYSGIEGLESTIISLRAARPAARRSCSCPRTAIRSSTPKPCGDADGGSYELIDLRARGRLGARGTPGAAVRGDHAASLAQPHDLRERAIVLFSENGHALGIDFGYDQAAASVGRSCWSLDGVEVDAVTRDALPRRPRRRAQPASRRRAARRCGRPRTSRRSSRSRSATTFRASGSSRSRSIACSQLGEPFAWHEYELTVYALPGHTLYAGGDRVRGRRPARRRDRRPVGGRRGLGRRSTTSTATASSADDFVADAELYATIATELDHQRPLAAAHASTLTLLERLARDARAAGASCTTSCCREKGFGDGRLRRAHRAVSQHSPRPAASRARPQSCGTRSRGRRRRTCTLAVAERLAGGPADRRSSSSACTRKGRGLSRPRRPTSSCAVRASPPT